jgi:hypothetical protein
MTAGGMADTTPPGIAEFEAFVMADTAPAMVIIDRALIRALLIYLRGLEREVAHRPAARPIDFSKTEHDGT